MDNRVPVSIVYLQNSIVNFPLSIDQIMTIYTKTGDKGTTSLFGGKRVMKSDLQVNAYGTVDELTAFIGLVITKLKGKDRTSLIDIQKDLYKIMSSLSGAKIDLGFLDLRVKEFEEKIDKLEKKLPELTRFILPAGSDLSSWFHVLRVTCRKSERIIVDYLNQKSITNYELRIIKYLNRLSDLFFVLARFYNKDKEILT